MKNDYYVYLHKTLDGNPFYVGKGRLNRAYSSYSRSKNWHQISKCGYTVELVFTNLTEKEALEEESKLILSTEGLVNRGVQSKTLFTDIEEYFKVDPESPSGLSRIKGSWTGLYFAGDLGPCGHIRKEKGLALGWRVRHLGKTLYIHRAVWQLVYGDIPAGFVIDHIDGNPLNNKIENLRCVPTEVNSRNKSKNQRNSSGITGVRFKDNGFEAKIVINDKCAYKRFGCKRHGYDEAFRLACEWRAEQIRLLNEQGAGYTERHGT